MVWILSAGGSSGPPEGQGVLEVGSRYLQCLQKQAEFEIYVPVSNMTSKTALRAYDWFCKAPETSLPPDP